MAVEALLAMMAVVGTLQSPSAVPVLRRPNCSCLENRLAYHSPDRLDDLLPTSLVDLVRIRRCRSWRFQSDTCSRGRNSQFKYSFDGMCIVLATDLLFDKQFWWRLNSQLMHQFLRHFALAGGGPCHFRIRFPIFRRQNIGNGSQFLDV